MGAQRLIPAALRFPQRRIEKASVPTLVGLLLPRAKRFQCFVTHELNHRDLAFRVLLHDFTVDERVVEAGDGCIRGSGAEENPRRASPIDGSQTHGAGLAGRVKLTIPKLENAKLRTRSPDRYNFRMCGRIIRQSHAIHALRNYFRTSHHDRTEWTPAPGADILDGDLNRARHEWARHLQIIERISRQRSYRVLASKVEGS
jgi:hypothetical protein